MLKRLPPEEKRPYLERAWHRTAGYMRTALRGEDEEIIRAEVLEAVRKMRGRVVKP